MGLNSSKAHGKVTRVAPLPSKEEPPQPPGSGAVQGFQRPLQGWSVSPFASAMERTPVWERPLPPLRETWLGRYPAVPRAAPSQRLEAGETSIIKQHPPRRFQKLEPLVLAKDSPPDKSWSLQSNTRGLEKREPGLSRQHFHKMRMLEMRREAELKSCLQQKEAGLCNPRSRDRSAEQTLGRLQGNDSSDGEDLLNTEHDQTFHGDDGDLWDEDPCQVRGFSGSHPGQDCKVERWLLKQQAKRESFWDTSSTDSETWDGHVGKPFRRPALVRTKAERIPLFDEFFDKEF